MKNITQSSKVIVLALVLSFGLSYVYAWTAPTVSAPGGNVSAPINTSTATQVKDGTLGITGLIRGYTGALLTGTTATNPVAGACPAGYYWVDGNGNGTIENGECKIISLYAKSDGNVGVGTTNPAGMLQIGTLFSGGNGSINGASNPTRLIVNGTSGSESALTLGYYSAGYGLNLWVPANPSAPWPTYIDNINANSGFRFRNHTSATPVDLMTIDETGRVGIGTTAPATKLDVAGAIKATGDICTTTTGSSVCLSAGGTTTLFNTSGTYSVPAGVTVIYISGMGSSGGGASGAGSNTGAGGGAGGASGNIIPKIGFAVTPGTSLTVTIGSKGIGGAATGANTVNNSGSDGGTTSVGALLTVPGGAGGIGSSGSVNGANGGGLGGGIGGVQDQNGNPGGNGTIIGGGGGGATGISIWPNGAGGKGGDGVGGQIIIEQ